ncbi:phytoene desaturase [bacterium]|nr:phytoene desaturase [bacterium]
MNARSAIVVGSGIGGLATAIRLGAQGLQVTVLEKQATLGGRSGVWEAGGFRFDTGPTLLLMIDQLSELFASVGRRLEDYLDLVQLDPNYRVSWHDGSHFDNSSTLNKLLSEVERLEPGAGPRALEFLAQTQRQYRLAVDAFVSENFTRWHQFLNPTKLRQLFQVKAHQTLYPMVGKFFKDRRLREAFSFQSMYLGLSPYESPAVYGLLPFTETGMGLFFPKGGLYAIVEAMERLGREFGVRYECDWEVGEIRHAYGRASGVVARDGRTMDADLIVANADLPYVYEKLLPDKRYDRLPSLEYTCSGYLMYLGVNREYPQLLHHNLIVSRDLKRNFRRIFQDKVLPDDPAFYICNPNKTDPSLAPEGCENLYVLVPVPHQTPNIDWGEEEPRFREAMYDRLEAFGLTNLRKHVVVERIFTPDDFLLSLNSARGSAFGLAHTIPQIGYFRPHNRHKEIDNLYFVGCSTQPGTGIPMVLISARLVTERIESEHSLSQARPPVHA